MASTNWLGLWKCERQGYYSGSVIKKKDIPAYTRVILRYNKFYEKDGNRPKFVFCFADAEGYESKCIPIEMEDEDTYTDKDGNRLYTEEEVYRIIHGMEEEYGLSWGDNLISDYI